MNTSVKQNFGRYQQYSVNLVKYYRIPSVQKSLYVVLSLFISAVFIIFAIRPTLIAIAKLKQTIAESETTLTQLKAKTVAVKKASEVWKRLKPMQPKIEASFPVNGPDYQNITESLEVLAKEEGITIVSESIGEALIYSRIIDPYTGKNRTVIEMPLSLTIVGSYQQLLAFLDQILNMSRIYGIENLSISKEASKANVNATGLLFSLSGKIYYLANEEQLSTVVGIK